MYVQSWVTAVLRQDVIVAMFPANVAPHVANSEMPHGQVASTGTHKSGALPSATAMRSRRVTKARISVVGLVQSSD